MLLEYCYWWKVSWLTVLEKWSHFCRRVLFFSFMVNVKMRSRLVNVRNILYFKIIWTRTLFKTCAQYNDLLDKAQLLTQKLLKQCYLALRLKSSLQNVHGRHHELLYLYIISISHCYWWKESWFTVLEKWSHFCHRILFFSFMANVKMRSRLLNVRNFLYFEIIWIGEIQIFSDSYLSSVSTVLHSRAAQE
jgi:hypothetical protein